MKFYQCQECGRQTTSPKTAGWKQLVHQSNGITIRIIVCNHCAPKNGENE